MGEWDLNFCTTNNIEGQTNTISKTHGLKPNPIALHFKKFGPSMTKMEQNRKINWKSLRYQGIITGNRPMNTRLQGCAQTICQ